ncbi:MAG: hypothetical protein ABIE74_09995 [Pseudomonadota bacterium]
MDIKSFFRGLFVSVLPNIRVDSLPSIDVENNAEAFEKSYERINTLLTGRESLPETLWFDIDGTLTTSFQNGRTVQGHTFAFMRAFHERGVKIGIYSMRYKKGHPLHNHFLSRNPEYAAFGGFDEVSSIDGFLRAHSDVRELVDGKFVRGLEFQRGIGKRFAIPKEGVYFVSRPMNNLFLSARRFWIGSKSVPMPKFVGKGEMLIDDIDWSEHYREIERLFSGVKGWYETDLHDAVINSRKGIFFLEGRRDHPRSLDEAELKRLESLLDNFSH